MPNPISLLKSLRLARATVSIGVGLCLCINATAQTTSAQERDLNSRNQQELLRQQQQEQQQRQKQERTPDVRLTAPEESTTQTLPIETPCFSIRRLQLQNGLGVPLPEFDWVVEQLTAPDVPVFIGQCVGAQGVAWLIERTQKILVDRGLVTSRVLVTQQDMSQGTLVLTLIPGRIHAIRLTEPVDPRANLSNALPMQSGAETANFARDRGLNVDVMAPVPKDGSRPLVNESLSVAPSSDPATKLQTQIQNDSNTQMNQLLQGVRTHR